MENIEDLLQQSHYKEFVKKDAACHKVLNSVEELKLKQRSL